MPCFHRVLHFVLLGTLLFRNWVVPEVGAPLMAASFALRTEGTRGVTLTLTLCCLHSLFCPTTASSCWTLAVW